MTKKNNKPQKDDNFIMLPTVDFCFKEMMRNEKVRKGIISALLHIDPEEVEQTTLMPTILRKESVDDKYGILDVRVKLKNGTDLMEIYVLELKKLPPEDQNDNGLIKWLRFIKAENKEALKKDGRTR